MFFKNKITSIISTGRSSKTEKSSTDIESSKESLENSIRKNTYFDGLVNNFRSTVGTGILALPIAFSQGGYLGGIIGIIFIAIITNYCALVLVGCQRELLRRNKDMIPTYQGTVQAAFADGPKSLRHLTRFFVTFTNVLIMIGQVGGVCVDFVFISSNVKAACYPYLDLDLRYFELMVFVPLLAVSMIPNMKKLSIVSSFGNVIILTSIGVVLYYILREPISFEGKHAFGTFKELPHFLGTVFFSGVTITLILPMENEMKRPGMLEGPCGVLNMTAYLCSTLYIFFGLMGYLRYGDEAASTVTLNLPAEDWLSLTVQLLLAVSAFTSLAIYLYIGVAVIWEDYLDKRLTKHRTLAQVLLRIGFAVLTLIISLLVPDLQLLLSALGIFLECTLHTTLPIIVNILMHYQQPSLWAYIRKFWLDAVTFVFTIFVLVSILLSRFVGE